MAVGYHKKKVPGPYPSNLMRSDLPVTFDSGIGLVPEVMSMCQVHVITRTYPYWNTTLRQSVIEALKRLLVAWSFRAAA